MAYTDAFLDAKRGVGDPLADGVMERIMQEGLVGQVETLFGRLQQNRDQVPAELPGYVRDFFQQDAVLPSWYSASQVAQGQEVFERYGPLVLTVLLYGSLPLCYAAAPGVKVVKAGGKLARGPRRRTLETTRLVVDVLSQGGFEPDGRGLRSTQKVRLVHAMLRRRLADDGWDSAADRTPINQEDLAGTMLAFSVVITEGLQKLGVELSPGEQDAFLHTWKVIGHVLGIDGDLLPATVQEALDMQRVMERRHYRASPEGEELAGVLIELGKDVIPGRLFDGIPVSMTRYLVGDAYGDVLGLPSSDWSRHLIRFFKLTGEAVDDVGDVSAQHRFAMQKLGASIVQGLIKMEGGEGETRFSITDQQQQQWLRRYPPLDYSMKARLVRFVRGFLHDFLGIG